jgi:hypothetical protein
VATEKGKIPTTGDGDGDGNGDSDSDHLYELPSPIPSGNQSKIYTSYFEMKNDSLIWAAGVQKRLRL